MKHTNILLVLILGIAIFLRFFQLGAIPNSLNPDETAIGYTAYSLLKTGADEHGSSFPLVLKSFGDWKLPVYPLLTIIPVFIFGLSEFSVRFISAAAGVISVLLIYSIALELFKKKEIGLFSAFFFSINPWSVYFSRAAFEPTLGILFFLLGILFFLKSLRQKKGTYVFISIISFGLMLFTYHAFLVFTPIFVCAMLFFYREEIVKDRWTKVSLVVLLVFFVLAYIFAIRPSLDKLSGLTFLKDPAIIYNRVDKLRGDSSNEPAFIKTVLHNKYIAVPYQVLQNYTASFSPSFLFDRGGEKLFYNLGYFGNFYLFDALILACGLGFLLWNREKNAKFLLIWLLIAPIASSITKDAPSSTRLFQMMPLFILVLGYGAYYLLHFLLAKRIFGRLILLGLVLGLVLNVILFLDGYFVHMNAQRARFWHYGFKEAVNLSKTYPDYNVVMRGPEDFPYVSFLFYNKYDPLQFRREVTYYPLTQEGFQHVKSFGRFSFPSTIDYSNIKKRTLYIDSSPITDKENTSKYPPIKVDRVIRLPSGDPIFVWYLYN